MTRLLIIDDETQARINLHNLLKDYCTEFEVLGMAAGVVQGIEMIERCKPDAIFCDIEMQDGTGFDLLDHFEQPTFQIVFVTAYDDYAIKAFRYNAIDYLLKPINPKELQAAFQKISINKLNQSSDQINQLKQSYKQNRFNTLSLSNEDGLHLIQISDIIRLEGFKNYTTFYCKDMRPILVSKNLGYYVKLLDEQPIFRCHQSHAIHLRSIKRLSKTSPLYIEMINGDQVPISRRRKDDLEKAVRNL